MNDKTGIVLYPAAFLSGVGKRENNEDAYYPYPDLRGQVSGLYMVCDGVGGIKREKWLLLHCAGRSAPIFLPN